MTDSFSCLHDPYDDQLAAARYRAERDMLAQAMERVDDDIEWTFLGFEGAEDAPAMRWAREFRAALGSLHAPGFQKSRKVATSLTSHSDASDVTMSAPVLAADGRIRRWRWLRWCPVCGAPLRVIFGEPWNQVKGAEIDGDR